MSDYEIQAIDAALTSFEEQAESELLRFEDDALDYDDERESE